MAVKEVKGCSDVIELNGETYVRAGSAEGAPVILVLQRGWVVVGWITEETESKVVLKDASVIRAWGTTKGLGELALCGPLTNTKLDPCGAVEAHPLGIVLRMPCDASKWGK